MRPTDDALLTVFGLLVAGVWYFYRAKIKQKVPNRRGQKEVDELQQVIKEVEEFKRRRDELTRKVQIITDLKNNQRGPVQIMDEVSRALPELIWLTSMEVRPNAINFRGTAMNMSAVANFIENLDRVEPFAEPILQDTTRARGTGAYNYRMTLGYSFTKAPVATAAPGAPGTEGGKPATGAVAAATAAKAARTANERGVE
jgi:type IV pilus assembly protein PilN